MRLKDLEQIAILDRLINLANRHYLEMELEASMEKKRRYGTLFGVLFMDIDDFKQVNDQYGHEVGERVLQFVAGTFSANSSPFDLYG
jgi:diguanylate cyclase (GGDEF)-like protein